MSSITTQAHARAGLVGNPSDGYFGKTISFTLRDFAATVTLEESDHFEVKPGDADLCRFNSVADFLRDAKLMGYYGGLRLVKASVKRFHDYCGEQHIDLSGRPNFTLSYATDIPRLVGLSGSSAIVVVTLRALMRFYEIDLPKPQQPTLALSVETKELDIAAGLQDRVVQVYEGLVYMDFDRALVESTGAGKYENLTPNQPPPVYVAFDPERAEVSGVTHRNLRQAWERGEQDVVDAMQELRALTDDGRLAVESGDVETLHRVTNQNFEVRRRIMPIAPENQRMVDVARSSGASAKFAGSGGAIVGVYRSEAEYDALQHALSTINCTTLKPRIFE